MSEEQTMVEETDTLTDDPPMVGADTIQTSPDALIGTVIDDRYQLESILGDGGMGIVYAGRHIELNRPLAVKVLRREIALSKSSLRRFEREAQAATALNHHHIITTLDFGRLPDGAPYMVMERLDGAPLDQVSYEEGAMKPARAVKIARQLCEALAAAHATGIIHRDLKPENIQLVQSAQGDFVKVLDFGIAKVSGVTQLTATGHIIGTPRYMSPEQCRGDEVDPRADIYSVGIILYELVTGRLPFDGDLGTVIRHQLSSDPVPPSHFVSIPAELEEVILRCMAKDPAKRFESAEALDAALARVEGVLETFEPSAVTAGSAVVDAPRTSPTKIYAIAGIGAILIGSAVGTFFLNKADAPSVETSGAHTAPPSAGQTAPPEPTTEATTEELSAEEEVPMGMETPEPTARASIHIVTTPPRAAIFTDDFIVGNAPLDFQCAPGKEECEIEVRLSGYVTRRVEIDADTPSTLPVTLTSEAEARAARRRARMTVAVAMEATPEPPPPEPAMEPTPMMRSRSEGLGLLTPSSWDD